MLYSPDVLLANALKNEERQQELVSRTLGKNVNC